jgi:hypothetical protein
MLLCSCPGIFFSTPLDVCQDCFFINFFFSWFIFLQDLCLFTAAWWTPRYRVQFLIESVCLSVCVFVLETTSPLHFRCYSKFVIIFFNTSTCVALNFNSVRSRVRIPWYCLVFKRERERDRERGLRCDKSPPPSTANNAAVKIVSLALFSVTTVLLSTRVYYLMFPLDSMNSAPPSPPSPHPPLLNKWMNEW